MTMFTISPNAAVINKPSTSVDTLDYSITGENTFGEMISSEIAESQGDAQDFDSEYKLFDVTVKENTANVEYHSLRDCTILAAVYDERTDKMLASGKSKASADKESVDVILETEKMPDYFVVKVYMLDENNAPLTNCLVEELYTESVQRVVALDSSEFDEKKVLNFDEDTSTNFAIYNDNAKVIKASEYNIPTSIDEKSGTYSFTNCDDKLTSLKKGDILAYEYKKGGVLIVKINEITVDDTTVTITEDSNLELKDVFDYIKIESTQTTDQTEVDTSSADEGVTYKGRSSESFNNNEEDTSSVGASWSDEAGVSENFEVEFPENEVGKVGISGKAGLSLFLSVSVELYIGYVWEIDAHYIDFSIEYGVQIEGEIEVKFTKPIKKVLSTITVPVIPEVVTVTFEPKIVFELSAKFSATLKYSGTIGFKATLTSGVEDTSKPMKVDAKLKVEGDGFIGLDFCPSVQFVNRYVAEVELNFTIGARIHAELEVGTKDEDDDHECTYCVSGTMGPEASISGKVSLVTKTVGNIGHTFKFFTMDFYYSIDHNKFGWGECPYKKEPITEPSSTEPTSSEPASTEPTEEYVYKTGYCGSREDGYDSIKWVLDGSTLTISGHGAMYDFTGWWSDVPSSVSLDFRMYYSKNVKNIIIEEGVTHIGVDSFSGLDRVTTVSIPDTVESIGEGAFSSCYSLKSINLTDSITYIGSGAFSDCQSLTDINFPNSLTSIGMKAFMGCISLKEADLSQTNLKELGSSAFYNCISLEKVNLPDQLTSIQSITFKYCMALPEIKLPAGLKEIKSGAFEECKKFTSIVIPQSVESIDDGAFRNCSNLTDVTLSINAKNVYAFKGCPATFHYYEDDNINSVGASYAGMTFGTASPRILSAVSDNSKITAEYRNKVANAYYIIAVVKDPNAEDVLSADNLLYINQYTADKNGKISASLTVPDGVGDDYEVLIFGAEGGTDVHDTPEKGDVNGDGKVSIDDVTLIQKYLANMTELDSIQLEAADVNDDGNANIDDVTMIQKYLVGMLVLE